MAGELNVLSAWKRFETSEDDEKRHCYVRETARGGELFARELQNPVPVEGQQDFYLGEPVGVTREDLPTHKEESHAFILNVPDPVLGKNFAVTAYPGDFSGILKKWAKVDGIYRVAEASCANLPSTGRGGQTDYRVIQKPWKGRVISFIIECGGMRREHSVNIGTFEHEIRDL